MNFLVADSGSSKAEWHFQRGEKEISFRTSGFNPYFFTPHRLSRSVATEVAPQLHGEIPDTIFFYGAGCAAEDRRTMMIEALRSVFLKSTIEVNDDLLAAARGLLQKASGFIAILGTGMNNGIFDGEKIIQQVDSLGFILGDEGSGTAIGKRLLKSFLRKEFPEVLHREFENEFKLTREEILNSVYSGIEANRFIAGFAQFAAERKSDPFIRNLIKNSFTEFFEKIVSKFPSYKNYSFNCVGSVGFFFSEILIEIAEQFGMKTGKILQSPMDGLVKFHSENEKANH
ncbi:MAG: hypothetical protein ACHQD9_02810 [Chitinophagales bacterium]